LTDLAQVESPVSTNVHQPTLQVQLPQPFHQPQCQVQCPTTDPWNALKMARVAPAVARVGWEITTTAVIARVEKAARVPT